MPYTLTACPSCRSYNVSLTLVTSSATYRRCMACGDMWTEREPPRTGDADGPAAMDRERAIPVRDRVRQNG